MQNIKHFLSSANELQELADKRAEELLMAYGCKFNVYITGRTFNSDSIDVYFKEQTNSDDPDNDSMRVELNELEMTDEEFEKHIQGIRSIKLETEAKARQEAENAKREKKQKEYESLKKELGY